jgi:hypothetical protein
MLFDTDVLIWVFRGNQAAARMVELARERALSVMTHMELVQGARSKQEVKAIKGFLADFAFAVLPLTENIGHRAMVYMEEYSLRSGMSAGDALVAATAVEQGLPLCTANRKHYRLVQDLELKVLRP